MTLFRLKSVLLVFSVSLLIFTRFAYKDFEQETCDCEHLKEEKIFGVTSGKEFSGKKIRTYKGPIMFSSNYFYRKQARKSRCAKWGVVTTIFEPSESVRRFMYRKDWCIIVVGDLMKPKVSINLLSYF